MSEGSSPELTWNDDKGRTSREDDILLSVVIFTGSNEKLFVVDNEKPRPLVQVICLELIWCNEKGEYISRKMTCHCQMLFYRPRDTN